MQGITLMGHYLSADDFVQGKAVPWMQAHQLPAPVQAFLQHWFTTDAPVLAQTSGSTGPPKTITLQRAQMIASAQLTALQFGFRPGMRALLPLSADFIAGKMMLVRAIVSGLDLHAAAPTQNLAALFPGVTFHFTPLVPAQLHALITQGADVARLGTLLLGGSDVSPELLVLMPRLEQQEVWQGFGMTETVSHIALRRMHPEAEIAYQTLPGLLTETDENGQLRVWGAVTNYHWLKTNDVVTFDEPGRFRWLGRSDNVIVSGGHKVHPEILEQTLMGLLVQNSQLDQLRATDFYISAIADAQYGQVPVLVYERQSGIEQPLFEGFLLEVKPHLPSWEFPRKVIGVDAFARTANGKIKRQRQFD
jgi:O-succinylbenzoic acid--CoA ligase